jgi:hypothetical protein
MKITKYTFFIGFLAVFLGLQAQVAGQSALSFVAASLTEPVNLAPDQMRLLGFGYSQTNPSQLGAPRAAQVQYAAMLGEHMGLESWIQTAEVASLQRFRGGFSYVAKFGNKRFQARPSISAQYGQSRLSSAVFDNPLNDASDRLLTESQPASASVGAGMTLIWQRQLFVSFKMPSLWQSTLSNLNSSTDAGLWADKYRVVVGMKCGLRTGSSINAQTRFTRSQSGFDQVSIFAKTGFQRDLIEIGGFVSPGQSGRFGVLAGLNLKKVRAYYLYECPLGAQAALGTTCHLFALQFNWLGHQRQFDRSIKYQPE